MLWCRGTVTIFSESKTGTRDLLSASVLMGKMAQNIWNWDCPGKLRTYGLRMHGASCYFKDTVPGPAFLSSWLLSATEILSRRLILPESWTQPHQGRQDVNRVSLTRRKGPELVTLQKPHVHSCRPISLPSPPCSLHRSGSISEHTCLLPSA